MAKRASTRSSRWAARSTSPPSFASPGHGFEARRRAPRGRESPVGAIEARKTQRRLSRHIQVACPIKLLTRAWLRAFPISALEIAARTASGIDFGPGRAGPRKAFRFLQHLTHRRI